LRTGTAGEQDAGVTTSSVPGIGLRPIKLSKRFRNRHRKALEEGETRFSLKTWARLLASTATKNERDTTAAILDINGGLRGAALAWHWLESRGVAA
jgi:hypothetical protein